MELPLSFGLITGEFFHLRICLGVEKIFGPKIVLHCSRPCDLEYLGIFFCYILNFYVYKTTVCGESLRKNEDEFSRKANGGWIFLGIKRGLQKNKIIM